MTERPETEVIVDDAALARVAAYEAASTPGVARLHPYAIAAARQAVESAARRATALVTGADSDDAPGADAAGADTAGVDTAGADPAAVDVDRDADTGVVTLTVRIVVTTDPPVLATVREVQQRINARITDMLGAAPVVAVRVMDVDLPG